MMKHNCYHEIFTSGSLCVVYFHPETKILGVNCPNIREIKACSYF